MKWTESAVAHALVHQVFDRQYLAVVPRCNWTGNECDLLVVTDNLRLIDVEIKCSRDDLKADAKKSKWWYHLGWRAKGPQRRRLWPAKVWKHYYALPADIWDDSLYAVLGSEASGVLLLTESKHTRSGYKVDVRRRAKPCREAEPIGAQAAIDIARLASLRMWDALLERKT